MTGLELREEAAALARENLARNGLGERSEILTGDIREHRSLFSHGSFDLAVANPPYFAAGSGASSPDPARAGAREERDCTLPELCAAAAFLLPTGGRFCLVHRPERLSELFVCMSESGLEPKRLRLVCARAESAPSLVLAEGRRGGKAGSCDRAAAAADRTRREGRARRSGGSIIGRMKHEPERKRVSAAGFLGAYENRRKEGTPPG